MSAPGVILSDDLIFYSRIAEYARAANLAARQARTPAEFQTLCRANPPVGVILDLQNPGLNLPALLAELRAACPIMPRVIAYGSHVEAEVLRAARAAGCDQVFPRSQFVNKLQTAIPEWFAHGS